MSASKDPGQSVKKRGGGREKAKAFLRKVVSRIAGKRGRRAVDSAGSSSVFPEASHVPVALTAPVVPKVPVVAGIPVAPVVPGVAEVPKVPVAPAVPKVLVVPEVPAAPAVAPATPASSSAATVEPPFAPFGAGRLVLLEIDPCRILAYWDVPPRAIAGARRRAGDDLAVETIRFHEVSLVDFDGTNARETFDVAVGSARGNYYVSLGAPGKALTAEVGVRGADGRFAPVTRSNVLSLPPDAESPYFDDRRRRVTGVASPLWRPRRVECFAGAGFGERAADAALSSVTEEEGEGEGEGGRSVGGAQAFGGARGTGLHRGEAATGAIEAAPPRAAAAVSQRGEVSPELPSPGWGRTGTQGTPVEGLPGANPSSESLPGAARPVSTLKIQADIVIYGRAPPGIEVVIDGAPVQVKADGTFDLRFALPALPPRPEGGSR